MCCEAPLRLCVDILQQTGFSKSPKSPPSTILRTLRFLSFRYGADFRRSRLVFLIYMMFENIALYPNYDVISEVNCFLLRRRPKGTLWVFRHFL